ncbi:MAG: T9SS type A sorting domain-containing protein, partial [Bacteroidales bacterium]|nr:T9SS type A sorting domain-containing protein [Bacteroidales bacterium]
MKKIILCLAVAACLAGGVLKAQQPLRHVYLYEDFSTPGTYFDTARWDLVTDTSYKSLYYSAFSNAGGLPPEALWGYAPSSGMNRRLSGTYRLVSKPQALPADERAYVAVKYYYYANQASEAGLRSLGLAVRIGGGEWRSCRTVEVTKTMPAARLVAELPAECRGAEDVQVAVCFNTRVDRAYYMLYFDDVEFFSYPEQRHDLTFSWRGRPYTANRFDTLITADTLVTADTLELDLCLENTGNAMTSCKIVYSFDGGEPQTLSLTFEDTLMPGERYTLAGFRPKGWENAAKGHHTVAFRLSEANGLALPESAVAVQVKILSIIDETRFQTYAYKPLVEEFSSSSCGSCVPRNQQLREVFDSLGDLVSVVKYQMYWPGQGDPYYTMDGGVRKLFYDIYNVPEIYLNGRHYHVQGGIPGMIRTFKEHSGAAAYFDIAFDTLALDADTNLYAVVNVQASVPAVLRLHTVVLEGQTEGNASTNGETMFQHVMLKMLPDAKGQFMDIKPDTTYTFRYGYDMKRTFMEEIDDLKVVCFLQADDDSVMQSVTGDVRMRIDRIPLAAERVWGYETLAVYPNPASDYVMIPGLENATVDIFDRTGRRVFHKTSVTGDCRWEVGSVRSGLYIIRV